MSRSVSCSSIEISAAERRKTFNFPANWCFRTRGTKIDFFFRSGFFVRGSCLGHWPVLFPHQRPLLWLKKKCVCKSKHGGRHDNLLCSSRVTKLTFQLKNPSYAPDETILQLCIQEWEFFLDYFIVRQCLMVLFIDLIDCPSTIL